MEFTVEIEIWKLKLSFETLVTGTVIRLASIQVEEEEEEEGYSH